MNFPVRKLCTDSPLRVGLLVLAVAVVLAFYFSGRLDYALYPVGLNFHGCARNGYGATFCGGDLTAYQARIRGVQQQVQSAEQTMTQSECRTDPQLSFCP